MDMVRTFAGVFASTVLAVGALAGAQAAQKPVTLQDLTVPRERLPSGCQLYSGPSSIGLPLAGNPWIGHDRAIVASIRERLGPPLMVPDGPPLSRTQLAEFRLALADGIDEAYAAVYQQADATSLEVVYGLRFPTAAAGAEFLGATRTRENRQATRVAIGPIVAVLHGAGPCAPAIAAYLSSLAPAGL